jgi:Family of unknown function (DUF6714)
VLIGVSDENRTALVNQIQAAFETEPYPGDDRLVNSRGGYHLEANQIAAAFQGKHWRQLDLRFLFPQRQSLYFFTPEAFRFFLPAYLLASLGGKRVATDVRETVLFSLMPPKKGSKEWDWFAARIEPLSSEQKMAITEFLKYLQRHFGHRLRFGEIDALLDCYWSRFVK